MKNPSTDPYPGLDELTAAYDVDPDDEMRDFLLAALVFTMAQNIRNLTTNYPSDYLGYYIAVLTKYARQLLSEMAERHEVDIEGLLSHHHCYPNSQEFATATVRGLEQLEMSKKMLIEVEITSGSLSFPCPPEMSVRVFRDREFRKAGTYVSSIGPRGTFVASDKLLLDILDKDGQRRTDWKIGDKLSFSPAFVEPVSRTAS